MAITFGILATLMTIVALWLGYVNNQAKEEQADHLKSEIESHVENEGTVTKLNTKLQEDNETFNQTLAVITEKLNERDAKETEKADLSENLSNLKSDVSDLNDRLADYQAKVPDIGKVDILIQDLQDAKKAIAAIEVNIDEVTQQNNTLSDQITQQNDTIAYQKKWISNHVVYQAQEELSTTVRAVYKNWGFVVVGAGDVQGVTPKSQLVVKRGEEVICELLVKTATNEVATAEIVFTTLKEGDFVQVGDTVSAKPVEENEVVEVPVDEPKDEPAPAAAPPINDPMVNPFG